MLKQKYFLAGIFILSAEKQPIKLSWRKIEWLHKDKRSWLNSLFQKILLEDVIVRNEIRNESEIRLLVKKLAERRCYATFSVGTNSGNYKISRLFSVAWYIGRLSSISEWCLSCFGISNYSDKLSEKEKIFLR